MFNFVHIYHIDDVRHAISENFFLAERDWGYVINYYMNAFPEIKDDMSDEDKELEYFRREFRGIKFDKQGHLIARPFHKFFNWGEKEAEMAHFDFNQPFVIMDKLDGSMMHPMRVDGKILWCSKMGPTDVAEQVARFVEAHPAYIKLADDLVAQGYTPIFEWVSRQQRIVVDYPVDNLILTAVRNMKTGEYIPYK